MKKVNQKFPKIDPEPKFISKIHDVKQKIEVFEINSSHGAKHSPSPLPLDWPLAGLGGPGASA